MQFNPRTAALRIGDKFVVAGTTYIIIHRIDREVDIDRTYGIIGLTARKAAGEELL